MKKKVITLILILTGVILSAITIPYSQTELKTETNHLSEFVRIAPDDSLAIPLQTDVWLWHDTENLFVLWEAEIDENFEKGKFAATDEWADCDCVRIQIITDVKNYYAYMFYSLPFGNQYDCIRKSDMNIDASWNSNYQYENSISDTLWTSSMKIPLKDLRFYGKPPYKWKIILTRYFQKADEYYSLPYGIIDMGKDYFRTAYDITINEKLSKNKNYRITPYFIKKYDLMEETDSFDPENIGLDFSYNPTSATKAKISLNPDFSDIPMDSEYDNFNVRYAPSYEENRFFFIEDLDVFGVSSNLFYSRHIMQPQYAVKLTGNSEHFSYGFLSAMDKEVSEDNEILNSDDFYNMLAFKPKWEDLSIQMTLLNRMNKDYHNEILIINPCWEFLKNQSVWSEINFSLKDEPDIERKKGYSVSGGYNGKKGDFNWSTSVFNRSKDYTADMGLVYITDFTALNAYISQCSDPNGKIIKGYGSNIWLNKSFTNDEKELLEQGGGVNFWANSPHKINFSINGNIGQESYEDSVYTWDNLYANLSIWNISWLSAWINYSTGHSLVYNLFEIFKKDYISLGFSGDIGNNFSYNVSAQRQRYFGFPTDCEMDDVYWIGNADLTINFSNKLSLKNGLRYNNYESDNQIAYLGFFSNLRYEFKDNCNLYLGYKTAQDEIEQEFITDYKQAYMKVSYTF
ncbi:MAG: hypothetical protein Q7J16_05130 [Candidatus Cloacimonadales bacterium]|nr:hypothetical protein [Candidatus Cloacimonadales bacterium]